MLVALEQPEADNKWSQGAENWKAMRNSEISVDFFALWVIFILGQGNFRPLSVSYIAGLGDLSTRIFVGILPT